MILFETLHSETHWQVEEVTPPDEVDSDDDASVLSEPQPALPAANGSAAGQAGGRSGDDGGGGAAEADDVRQIAAAPGVCQSGGECATWEQDSPQVGFWV